MLAVTPTAVHCMPRPPEDLRSRRWFAANDMRGFAHRQRMQQLGLRREDVMGRPIVAIVNTWSELSPCHAHLRERAEAVKPAANDDALLRWNACARMFERHPELMRVDDERTAPVMLE